MVAAHFHIAIWVCVVPELARGIVVWGRPKEAAAVGGSGGSTFWRGNEFIKAKMERIGEGGLIVDAKAAATILFPVSHLACAILRTRSRHRIAVW